MALNINTSRALVGLPEQQQLIQAVLSASAADETLWLEWKSDLNLLRAAGAFPVAKAILGMANRMPDLAEQWMEGHAYVLVGAEPGNLCGTTEVDIAKLHPKLFQYTGDGPRFQYTYVPFDAGQGTRQVLLVDIAAPRWGELIHPLRKEFDEYLSGTVFMRYPGQTRQAKASEVDALCSRLLHGREQMNIEIGHVDGHVAHVGFTSEEPGAFLEKRREALLSSLPTRKSASPSLRLSQIREVQDKKEQGLALTPDEEEMLKVAAAAGKAIATQFSAALTGDLRAYNRDTRTPQKYRDEVDAYVEKCRAALPRNVNKAIAAHCAPVRLELGNRTGTNLTKVEVIATISGAFSATLPSDPHHPDLEWPAAPRPYGTAPAPSWHHLVGLHPSIASAQKLSFPQLPATLSDPEITITPESVKIRFPPTDVRPHDTIPLDPIVVYGYGPGEHPDAVSIKWTATCTNRDGRYTGELTVPVRPLGMTLAKLLKQPGTGAESS